ncbi:MAG: hypothetical protein MK033_04750 [Candidatus Caenarcaniphilales bacterium]|nr:hypothetical protein [Candidatus Caenarcaniphilales bacterium]
MQKHKTMMSNVDSLGKYRNYIEQLKVENELMNSSDDLVELCKSNFRRLSLVKKFSVIDEEILMYELSNIKDCSADFLGGILGFETTRMRFKEEITQCQEKESSQKYEII